MSGSEFLYRTVESIFIPTAASDHTHKPSFLRTLKDDEATLDVGNQTISRRIIDIKLCGLSMFGNNAQYHRASQTVESYDGITHAGEYLHGIQ
jgi:hypothetical protein